MMWRVGALVPPACPPMIRSKSDREVFRSAFPLTIRDEGDRKGPRDVSHPGLFLQEA
jgi:hypothetical protein